jgi:ribosomal protein L7/L12
MAKHATSRSEMLEREYEVAIALVVRAIGGAVLAFVAAYLAGMFMGSQLQWFFLILAVAAIAVALYGGIRVLQARNMPFVTFECPYCQFAMKFPEIPTEDYDCEGCHRRVYFEDDGRVADVIDVTCSVCRTRHKVSVKANRYLCDGCNRPLNLPGKTQVQPGAVGADALETYNVMLTEIGRNPTEVAMAVQDMLVCNMREARQRMQALPLIVQENVSVRKADAVGRRLEGLGATVAVKPAAGATHGGRP